MSSSQRHPVTEPLHWTPQSTTAGTLHDLKKKRSHEFQLRLFGAQTAANSGADVSPDVVQPSLSVAEIYGHANSSAPALPQRQNKLVQAVANYEPCCQLM